ncbi:MAG: Ig-like domain-containing protein, partial [Acidimicrobiales bacterium]
MTKFHRVGALAASLSLAMLALTALPGAVGTAGAGSVGTNLDQWANLPGQGWQNGDLNQNNSAYPENHVVPFRETITGLAPSSTNTITLQYDFSKSGHEAYDFLATYNATETGVTLCSTGGGAVSSMCPNLPSPVTAPFPTDSYVPSYLNTPGGGVAGAQALFGAANQYLTMYGATFGATPISQPVHSGGASDTVSETVTFVTPSSGPGCSGSGPSETCDVLLTWGGHLAWSGYWNGPGDANGSATIQGSPFHMMTVNLNGSGGANQDRSIQNNAIISNEPASVNTTPSPSGTSATDSATVSGGYGTPTGTVTFTLYKGTAPSGTATGYSDTVTLSGGTATSSTASGLAAGNYYFLVSYSGDGTYGATTGSAEPFSIGLQNASVNTTPSPSGTSATDSA